MGISMRDLGRTMLLSVSALLSSGTLIAAESASSAPTDFQIPAASLADALSKFGAQTGMQVVYAPELARGLKSRALSGRLTVDVALKQMLDGTGLTWSYVNGNTVVLKRAETETSAKKTLTLPSRRPT
jgi:type II secretory pathway component GspD/PulD (secretin)